MRIPPLPTPLHTLLYSMEPQYLIPRLLFFNLYFLTMYSYFFPIWALFVFVVTNLWVYQQQKEHESWMSKVPHWILMRKVNRIDYSKLYVLAKAIFLPILLFLLLVLQPDESVKAICELFGADFTLLVITLTLSHFFYACGISLKVCYRLYFK